MMDWTHPHWRAFIRGVTRKTVLYTEMAVDSTIFYQSHNLDWFIGKDIYEEPSVIQLGGNRADELAQAVDILNTYGNYTEFNLNCGCPSDRVSKRCFGAKLMLQPELVRQCVYEMSRKTIHPVTVKCRIGVDDHDSYDELTNFIKVAASGGSKKFIIHARKCLLQGLTTKQNRDVPPLHYDIVHQLQADFPDLKFIINGGIKSFDMVKEHMAEWNGLPALEGAMIGRQAYADPMMLANADSTFWGVKDPCPTRRHCIDRYLDYCDWIQGEAEPVLLTRDAPKPPKFTGTLVLTQVLHSVFKGCDGNGEYMKVLNEQYVKLRKSRNPTAHEIVDAALDVLPDLDKVLDEPLINRRIPGIEHLPKEDIKDDFNIDTNNTNTESVFEKIDTTDKVIEKFEDMTIDPLWEEYRNEFQKRNRKIHARFSY